MSTFSKEERLQILKNESRNYNFYLSSIERVNQQIEEVDLQIRNVHSLAMDSIRIEQRSDERPLIKLFERKQELINQRQYYQDRVRWIQTTMDSIMSPAYRYICWQTMVMKKSLHDLADHYELGADMIYNKRRKYLAMALTDEVMAEYDRISSTEEGQKRALGSEEEDA